MQWWMIVLIAVGTAILAGGGVFLWIIRDIGKAFAGG